MDLNGTYLTTAEASKALGVSAALLRTWRSENRGPEFIKIGAAVLYRKDDIERLKIEREVSK
ncbi:hypothetical protein SUDANB15_02611 [Streptomyces sp. enrichment culture]|uniref:helix-turn-helix domain-containing protein n=1 Tax=Streptomyces sp. enrichment culture TaxID=1795815 RepID=UPI003F56DDAA